MRQLALVLAAGFAISTFAQAPATRNAPAPTPAATKAPVQAQPTARAPQAGKAAAGKPTIEQFLKIRAPGAPAVTGTGVAYVRDWPDGINQLYRYTPKQGAKGDGAVVSYEPSQIEVKKLTDYKDGLAGFSLSRDDKRLLLANAAGGNENTQISILNPADDSITAVLQNPKVMYTPQRWLRDSSGFIYSANDTSASDFHLYRFAFDGDTMTGASSKILAREGSWSGGDITKDAGRSLVSRFISASSGEIYELDVTKGAAAEGKGEGLLTDLSIRDAQGNVVANELVGYMPDEKSILCISDVEDGRARLFLRNLGDKSVTKPIPSLDPYEIDSASINDERTILAVITNEDGYGALHLYSLADFKEIDYPAIEKGIVGVNSMRGNTIVYSLSNARTPGLAYSLTIPQQGAQLGAPVVQQLTFADTQGIDLAQFPLPELIKFKSFDGLEIPAFLWTPPGYKPGAPIPFVVNYHGGPEGQFRPGFDRTTQYLLSRGYGVMQPNVRGSTGYGRAFQMMDDYKKRWDSVKDGVEAARWLVNNSYAKAGKIAAYGGSYGGFMSVATIVEDGQSSSPVFGASVDVVGIVNMKTFLEQTSGYRRKLREAEYGPLTDPEFLASVSPLNKIDYIKVPMMIAHGPNDPRVPVGEAPQLAAELQKRGYDPELVYCPDEGHGFQKLSNRLLFNERMVKFLDGTIGK